MGLINVLVLGRFVVEPSRICFCGHGASAPGRVLSYSLRSALEAVSTPQEYERLLFLLVEMISPGQWSIRFDATRHMLIRLCVPS